MDLRPNKNLIDSTFTGYKLCFQPLPKLIVDLVDHKPLQLRPSNEQYSLQHAQLFGLHNYLFRDPWESRSVYYVDEDRSVNNVKFNLNTGKLQNNGKVYNIPKVEVQSGDYNPSVCFISEKLCLIHDGSTALSIIDTGDRYVNGSKWNCIASHSLNSDIRNAVLKDARFEICDNQWIIHSVLLNVVRHDEAHITRLTWVKLTRDQSKNWSLSQLNPVVCKSNPLYCTIEDRSKALLVCSDSYVSFKNNQQLADVSGDVKPKYTWSQTDEDVIVSLDIGNSFQKENEDYKVICKEQTLQIRFRNEMVLDLELFDKVKYDLTTWSLENDALQVNLMKSVEIHWSHLTQGLDSVETTAATVVPGYPLENDKEDCDELENEFNLVRIDVTTNTITNKTNLGINRPLFVVQLRPGYPSALAIQHDVDACIWLPKSNLENPTEWQMLHEGTVNAMGYIQASKQEKKFLQCSPDMSYTVISESSRYVYIYLSKHASASNLKNRNGGNVSVGQQKLYTLTDSDIVLGMQVENEVTFLLSDTKLICLKINE